MPLRRTALLGTLAVIVVVAGVGLIVLHKHTNGRSLAIPATKTRVPELQVTPINSKTTSPAAYTSPSQLACANTLCLLATANQSGNFSQLWARRAGHVNFTPLPAPAGSPSFVSGLSCQSSKICYAIIHQSSTEAGARILVTNDAGNSWNPLSLGVQFNPTSVGCLTDSSCWLTGASKGRPEVLVKPYTTDQTQPTNWTPVGLASEPLGASNQISCATTSNCIDIVGLPDVMTSSEEALKGGLAAGFTNIISATATEPQDIAGCDLAACYFDQTFGPGAGSQIRITSFSDNGSVATLAAPTRAGTFVNGISCSSSECMASAQTNNSATGFLELLKEPTPVKTPNGLSTDNPTLACQNTSPICMLTLYRSGVGPTSNYFTQLHTASLGLGSPMKLSTMAGVTGEPYSNSLISCTPHSCFEPVETTSGIELLRFVPGHDRAVGSFPVRDPGAGVGLLTPIAMTCPNVYSCKLIAEAGDSYYQLLTVDPISRQTSVGALPRGATPSTIACTSPKDCIITISGISHHHGFPAIWTNNAGKSWNSARAINAVNDLSSTGVSCQASGACITIGQHDFANGDGTLRPFIAYSHDNGNDWRLLELSGPLPYSLPGPSISEVACSTTSICSGVVATSAATLLLQGHASNDTWTVKEIHLHQVGQNAVPYSASVVCGSVHCLLSLTINPAGRNSKLSVQSLIISPGGRMGPVISGKLPSSGDLSTAVGLHHDYLDASPSATAWVRLNPE